MAYVPDSLWESCKEMIIEGRWFYIGGFRVAVEQREFRLTSHNLCIYFDSRTSIKRTKKKTRMSIYSFSTFEEISRRSTLHSICAAGFGDFNFILSCVYSVFVIANSLDISLFL